MSVPQGGPAAALLALAVLALPAAAAGQAACAAATEGRLEVQAGVVCACRAVRAGSLTATAAGFRWDCGILRPLAAPAPTAEDAADLPLVLEPTVIDERPHPPGHALRPPVPYLRPGP